MSVRYSSFLGKFLIGAMIGTSILTPIHAIAAPEDDELALIKAQIRDLQNRVVAIEERRKARRSDRKLSSPTGHESQFAHAGAAASVPVRGKSGNAASLMTAQTRTAAPHQSGEKPFSGASPAATQPESTGLARFIPPVRTAPATPGTTQSAKA
ncbi:MULTISPECIES: hypothetical protein [Asaia]|uniref:hypothetical protein n=1 Tax=Asaia TaxID=91914 RepID=UPI002FC2AA27